MALPTSATWDLADFSGSTLGSLLTLPGTDLTISPSTAPYFSYNTDFTVLNAVSMNGVLAALDFNIGIPSRFTLEVTLRFPAIPHNFGDLSTRRAGLTVADDAGRGVSIYFSSTGMAVSRVDDFGSVTALPDTAEVTEEIAQGFKTIRIAVDSGLGRAYVYIGDEAVTAEVDYILPVEATPPNLSDLFQVFVKGLAAQPSSMQIRALRLASDLVIPDIPPVAIAGPDKVASVGTAVRLDGRASYDVEGAALSYAWTAIDAPFGSQYVAENSSGSTTDDGDTDGVTNLLSYTAGSLPSWVAAGDQLRIDSKLYTIATVNNAGGTLTITTDSLSDALSAIPFRIIRQSILVGADTETPYIVPDVQGIYRFRLVVNDGESDSEASEVLASIVSARAPFGIEPDVSPIWKALGDEWNLIENRGVFEEAWKGAAQILAGKMLEVWQHHYNYSLRDAQRTFQRKWLAYRTLITETEPDAAVVTPRFGVLKATHAFESGAPVVLGDTLVFVYHTSTGIEESEVTLSGNSLSTIIADVNAALIGTGITAYSYALRREDLNYRVEVTGASTTDDGDSDGVTNLISFAPFSLTSWPAAGDTLVLNGERYTVATVNNTTGQLTITADELPDNLSGASFLVYRHCRLGIKAPTRGFYLKNSSTAASALGLQLETYNRLYGEGGALITDRTFFVGDGIDLSEYGVLRNDLLVLNNGQTFSIDRVLTSDRDPMGGQRLLLFDILPFDASTDWDLPSVVRSDAIDYEYEGSYPGDLVKAEVFDTSTNNTTDVTGVVLGQKGKQIAAYLSGFYTAFSDTSRYEIRLLGVKRRKGIPIYEDTVSIPRLQDIIPQGMSPTLWEENVHYVLEPFYRELNNAPIPFLQFRDSVFIDTDTEPPDILWAELTIFSNDQNIEDLFGLLAGFNRDDASVYDSDFNYVAGVSGLLYAQQRGPTVFSARIGAQILLGQSFAEVDGSIEEIRDDYSPTTGRMLVRDTGDSATPSEVVRTYYYKKDPLDLSSTSGLALNPDTGVPWAVGDTIKQFFPIGAGVELIDLYNDPKWYYPWVRSGLMTEIEKFHRFLVRFNLDLVSIANLSLLFQFITKIRPKYTYPFLVGMRSHSDDLDIDDSLSFGMQFHLYDSICGSGKSYRYDDMRGDGSVWSLFDDGTTYYDGHVDCPLDLIEFLIEIDWAGGVLTYDSAFFLDTQVTDVLGTFTTPGGTFVPTYDLNLPAGTYQVLAPIKTKGVVLP